jgi:O-antigen ligase
LGIYLAVAVAGFFMMGAQTSGFQRVLIDIADTPSSGAPTDTSTALRLKMDFVGFWAFLETPVF